MSKVKEVTEETLRFVKDVIWGFWDSAIFFIQVVIYRYCCPRIAAIHEATVEERDDWRRAYFNLSDKYQAKMVEIDRIKKKKKKRSKA